MKWILIVFEVVTVTVITMLMVTTMILALYETRTITVIIKGNFLFYPDDDDDQDWSFGSGCTEGCIILHVI